MGQYIASWSGGKESALALHRAIAGGMRVSWLFTMMNPNGFSMSHRIPRSLLRKQADLLGLPLVEGIADWNGYEAEFQRVLGLLVQRGACGCVFGDVDIASHREWCRTLCARVGIEAVHPLWGADQRQLVEELVGLGFEATIVVVNLKHLGLSWLGRVLDRGALRELTALGISPAGEQGEYHTLITAGPLLKDRLRLRRQRTLVHDGYGFLDLAE